MPVNNSTLNKNLFDLLRSKGYDPISLNSKGDPSEDIEEADVFRFNYLGPDGEKAGTGWATIEAKELVIYTNRDLIKAPNFEEFAIFMKDWARRKLLGFKVTNKDFLVHDMKKRNVMKNKENQINEGYYALGKKASYNDSIPAVKIIIQHTRQLEEGEQRFRNIAKIFVENTNGERFLLPTTRPGLARVYARHIAEGGTPYDDKAKHITTLVEEYTKMAGFVRATRKGQFNESALRLINEGLRHYNDLRMTLQGMASHRGYNKYFESYTPILNEESDDDITLNELFVEETLDPRIESVMPILKRLNKNITEMSEVNELAEWAESITEVEDETTKTLAEPAEEMLDEISIATLKSAQVRASDKIETLRKEIKRLENIPWQQSTGPANQEKIKKYEKAIQHYIGLQNKAGYHPHKMLNIRKDKEMDSLMPAKLKKVAEAPGAETLKHNQNTEKSNLKAFDLDEGATKQKMWDDAENMSLDQFTKKYGDDDFAKEFWHNVNGHDEESLGEGFSPSQEVADQIVDSLGGEEGLTTDDVYRAVEEYQSMMDNPHKLDADEVVQIVVDKMGIQELEEDIDANQKRVGQLGPTEKVGPKGAVGKLVGASESINYDEDKLLLDRITRLAGK